MYCYSYVTSNYLVEGHIMGVLCGNYRCCKRHPVIHRSHFFTHFIFATLVWGLSVKCCLCRELIRWDQNYCSICILHHSRFYEWNVAKIMNLKRRMSPLSIIRSANTSNWITIMSVFINVLAHRIIRYAGNVKSIDWTSVQPLTERFIRAIYITLLFTSFTHFPYIHVRHWSDITSDHFLRIV